MIFKDVYALVLVMFSPIIIIKTNMKSFIENTPTSHTIQSIDPLYIKENQGWMMMSHLSHTTKTYCIELES